LSANLLVIAAAAAIVAGTAGLAGPFAALIVAGVALAAMAYGLETNRGEDEVTAAAVAKALEREKERFRREKAEAVGEVHARYAVAADEAEAAELARILRT